MQSTDRVLAARWATGTAETYVQRNQDADWRLCCRRGDTCKQNRSNSQRAREEATDRLTAFRRTTGLLPGDSSIKDILERQRTLQLETRRTNNELIGVDAELGTLNLQLAKTEEKTTILKEEENPGAAEILLEFKQAGADLKQKQALYQPTNPLVLEALARCNQLADQVKANPPKRTLPVVTTNPEYTRIRERIQDLVPVRQSLRERLNQQQRELDP